MRILIPLFSPPTGTWGGLTRVLAVQKAAQAAGHEILFCASGSLARSLIERNLPVFETPATTLFGLPAPLSRLIEKRSQSMQIPVKPGKEIGNFWIVLTASGLANVTYLKQLVAAQLQAVQQFKPDILFTDADPGAYLTAAVSGIPIASSYASIIRTGVDSKPHQWIENAAAQVLKTYKLPAIPLESLWFGKQVLKIIPSIPELDDTPPGQPDVCFVGSLIGAIQKPTQRSEFDTGYRYVFAYLGTGSLSLDTARKVLPRVFPAIGNLHCLVGAQSITAPFQMEGVDFRPYVAAETLLPFCDWTICHGGQNTIIQSLQNSVPLLLFPGPIFERRFNAKKVIQADAGLMGEINQFTPAWFQLAFLQQAALKDQAEKLSRQIQAYGGAQSAVKAMQHWVNHN